MTKKIEQIGVPDENLIGIQVTTIGHGEYEKVKIIVQKIGNIFQYFFERKGEYYNGHNVITSENKDGLYTKQQLERAALMAMHQACAVIDILNGKKTDAQGEELMKIMEDVKPVLFNKNPVSQPN